MGLRITALHLLSDMLSLLRNARPKGFVQSLQETGLIFLLKRHVIAGRVKAS